MICSEIFTKFIEMMSTHENMIEVSQEAFGLLADIYHIKQVDFSFHVGNTIYTPGGEDVGCILYLKGKNISYKADYEREYHTGESGIVILRLYHTEEIEEWTETELTELDTVLNICFTALGRYRLIQVVKRNGLTDYLTGLPNADGYMEYAIEIFNKGELPKYNSYYFNLKRFGLLNRKFGPRETDEILKRYADILKNFADGEEIIGRLGGDNFVALIRKERTSQFLELISSVSTYGMLAGEKVPVIIKAVTGALEIEEDIPNCEPIISKCAVALNIARNVLKVPFLFSTKELDNRVYQNKQIAEQFPAALQENEFAVYYQPKVDTDSYDLVGAEALVRWKRNGSIVNPADFIPILEGDGAICKLDFYVLDQVCQDIRKWLEMGVEPVRISVNFSRKHLSNPDIVKNIMDVIHKYEIPVKYIEIEVTETVNEEEQGMLGDFVNQMKQNMVATAIDDFGTGYSSLNVLRSMPVNVLKIDKSFIDNDELIERDEIVLTYIIKMAKELDMDVITEGVETWEQVEFLRKIKCNLVQGCLFDGALSEEDFRHKLTHKLYEIKK